MLSYYLFIFGAVKTPRSDVDHSIRPPPPSTVRTACARTQVTFGPATPAPAPVDRPMDTGQVSTVYCLMRSLHVNHNLTK